ncbi:MAG: Gfo/Idh/MocA family oxidoreductase [Chloroflexi bacterium]|nr:Gfo/Idh/MocA family oxidoreductase [Chloroflexota bacterium]
MAEVIRWGILGTGNIAHQFARGLASADDAALVAVGSRTAASAEKFGNEFNVPRRHASYEALAADPEVDAIYVSTPHPYHKDNTLLCLKHGKAVLCEKPFAINRQEAVEMITVARDQGVFLMEAMWTRFTPIMVEVRRLLAEGAIGKVRMVSADFGFRIELDPDSRLFNLDLGGGALLDVGIYPISFASMILGAPSRIVSAVEMGPTGSDDQNALLFRYPGGEIAILASATRTRTPWEATIMGETGRIRVHPDWWKPQSLSILRDGTTETTIDLPLKGNGYEYEAEEVGRCLRAGLVESPDMTHAETLSLMSIMDSIRAEWGLVYPTETPSNS